MKRFFALIVLFGLALAAPSSTTLKSGVFFAAAGTDAKLRFEFKFGSELLFNRAGASSLSLETPWTKKPVELVLEKGLPYKDLPDEYLSTLEPIVAVVRVPVGTKAGVYLVKLTSEVFLCDNLIKVCYIDRAAGSLEIRVGAGKDVPVLVEFNRPNR
jgi:hypothetical protein